MIIESITLTDFRVFQGQHTFDLAPRIKYGKKRPIVLFGGLNGAGKTTTLTAVQVALYGKQSLGYGATQKAYEQFLTKSIHKSRDSLLQANTACIKLDFSYASMGVLSHYTVTRQWMVKGKKVIEQLSIAENGKPLTELNQEQCQGFLNELIPIGVSDLFFFDGEKIKELAEDNSGISLGDSIKKLLGLDIIETLEADLTILSRNEAKKAASPKLASEIDLLEKALEEAENFADEALNNWEQSKAKTAEHRQNLNKIENELSSKGGAWAATREAELEKEAQLRAEKEVLENQLREIIADKYPFSLAESFIKGTLQQLDAEQAFKNADTLRNIINKHLQSLDTKLASLLNTADHKKVSQVISKEFSKSAKTTHCDVIHDLSERALQQIRLILDDSLVNQQATANKLAKQIRALNSELDKAGKNIARAPEESSIKPILEKITAEQKKHTESEIIEKNFLEKYKQHLREAIDIARKLDKLSEQYFSMDITNRTLSYAEKSRSLLKAFSSEMAKRKIQDLESEFVESFHRLARKDDISFSCKIDPKTFGVHLIDKNGEEIPKEDLSAGEKQIYAIAILEALGKTSGRKLPIIIDTPLGRLDSLHRTNIIENYFPNASHQVIILSTDTEVEEKFYQILSTSISHAYKLDYDEISGSSTAQEGYFWKSKEEKIA